MQNLGGIRLGKQETERRSLDGLWIWSACASTAVTAKKSTMQLPIDHALRTMSRY